MLIETKSGNRVKRNGLRGRKASSAALLAAATMGVSAFATHKASAATVVWDGGTAGNGTAWLTATNWAGDALPGITDTVEFGTAGTGAGATPGAAGNTGVTGGTSSGTTTGGQGAGAAGIGSTGAGTAGAGTNSTGSGTSDTGSTGTSAGGGGNASSGTSSGTGTATGGGSTGGGSAGSTGGGSSGGR